MGWVVVRLGGWRGLRPTAPVAWQVGTAAREGIHHRLVTPRDDRRGAVGTLAGGIPKKLHQQKKTCRAEASSRPLASWRDKKPA